MRRIENNISPENPQDALKDFETLVPFDRYVESREIVIMARFLASDESKLITGSMHVVYGVCGLVKY